LNLEASFQVIPKITGETILAFGPLIEIERLCEAIVETKIPWVGLTVLNLEAVEALFPKRGDDQWALMVGLEDVEAARFEALDPIRKLCLSASCAIENFVGDDHEDIWTALDRLPATLEHSHPIWRRLHTTGTGSLETLVKRVPRGTPATARRLCGLVDLFYGARYDVTRHVAVSAGSWIRQLRPWRPALECSLLSSSVRNLLKGVKEAFDPSSILPSILGDNPHVSS
jgi:hypothetical protein